MNKLDQKGNSTPLIITIILVSILFIGSLIFGIWTFSSRQDYKNNVDQKIAAAVKVAQDKTSSAKDNEFAEKEKLPLKTFTGSQTYGSVGVKYPKTWSAYVVEGSESSNPLDGYFHPVFVPSVDGNSAFALRIQIVPNSYSQELEQYKTDIETGNTRATPFRPAKVKSVLGVRLDGQIEPEKQGVLVLLPLRDKTLKIWTESNQFKNDFIGSILPSLTFSP